MTVPVRAQKPSPQRQQRQRIEGCAEPERTLAELQRERAGQRPPATSPTLPTLFRDMCVVQVAIVVQHPYELEGARCHMRQDRVAEEGQYCCARVSDSSGSRAYAYCRAVTQPTSCARPVSAAL